MTKAHRLLAPIACLFALVLPGCQTTEERLITAAANEEANTDLLSTCELTGATLTNRGNNYRLALPPAMYAAREQAPTAGRIACLTHWAREHSVSLNVVEARR